MSKQADNYLYQMQRNGSSSGLLNPTIPLAGGNNSNGSQQKNTAELVQQAQLRASIKLKSERNNGSQ